LKYGNRASARLGRLIAEDRNKDCAAIGFRLATVNHDEALTAMAAITIQITAQNLKRTRLER
jgi:hypothetical protein